MVLHYIDVGQGEPIVLLHGMAASGRYWEAYLPELSKTHRVITIDLMGFGHSPQSPNDYTAESHARAISQTLESIAVEGKITLVGHSMGALIALKFATMFPAAVSELVLIGMPVYQNPKEARLDITKSKKRLKLAYYGKTSHMLCTSWCYLLRPISKRVAPLYLRHLPKEIAKDSVLHTWWSYSESLHYVIETQNVTNDLNKINIPTVLVYGDKESSIILQNVQALKAEIPTLQLRMIEATHNLPLERQRDLVQIIT